MLADSDVSLRIDPMQLKHIFGQINPEYGYLYSWTPRLSILETTVESLVRGGASMMGESIPLKRVWYHTDLYESIPIHIIS